MAAGSACMNGVLQLRRVEVAADDLSGHGGNDCQIGDLSFQLVAFFSQSSLLGELGLFLGGLAGLTQQTAAGDGFFDLELCDAMLERQFDVLQNKERLPRGHRAAVTDSHFAYETRG